MIPPYYPAFCHAATRRLRISESYRKTYTGKGELSRRGTYAPPLLQASWCFRENRTGQRRSALGKGDGSRGFYCEFCERFRAIFFVLPSQLPTTFCPLRSPLAMMVNE